MLGSNRTLFLFTGLPDALQAEFLRIGIAFSQIIGGYTAPPRLDLSIGKELCMHKHFSPDTQWAA